MGFGRGVLLWLLGIPIPIILLLALFWHHWLRSKEPQLEIERAATTADNIVGW